MTSRKFLRRCAASIAILGALAMPVLAFGQQAGAADGTDLPEAAPAEVGVDAQKLVRLSEWLREQDLLIRRKKSYVITTQSKHRFWVHSNLTEQFVPQKANELWVSDITYIRTLEGFCYLALITDAFSRKIVGYDISDSLELNGCLRALKSATQTATALDKLIHHSDRGIQYCSNQYTDLLREKQIRISMAANNAIAMDSAYSRT